VLATVGTIIPNAVGVDIGCGMLACRTNLHNITQDEIKKIMGIARKQIPVGFKHRSAPLDIPARRNTHRLRRRNMRAPGIRRAPWAGAITSSRFSAEVTGISGL